MNEPWGTEKELFFISRLGQFSEKKTVSRQVLLRRYLKATKLRADWDGMDRITVINAARMALLRD